MEGFTVVPSGSPKWVPWMIPLEGVPRVVPRMGSLDEFSWRQSHGVFPSGVL